MFDTVIDISKNLIITMARKTAANLNMYCVGLHI